jgi:hypothetical protein
MHAPAPALSILLAVAAAVALAATPLPAQLGWNVLGAPGPTKRHSHAMAYDQGRGVIVLFGGLDDGRQTGQLVGDTWEHDGSSWTRVATSGPSPRLGAAMVHDARRGVVLLFGGSDGTFRDDTWEWDGRSWRQVATGGPGARSRHAMAYDAARGVTVLFGALPVRDNQTWEWDGAAWRQVSAGGPADPVARSRTAMAYDPLRRRTVLFGGLDRSNGALGDTWEWDGLAWTQVATTGPAPAARSRHPMVWDGGRGVCRLFSGNAGSNLRDTWEWDGAAWRQVATGGPPPRMYHAMAHHQARGTSLVFGGWDLSAPLADSWEYAPTPPCVTPTVFGCETPGCAGAARLSAASCPRVGNAAFAIEVSNGVPDSLQGGGAFLMLSDAAAPGQSLPCSGALAQRLCVNVKPLGLDFALPVNARGRGALALPIPNIAALSGHRVFAQLVIAHPGHDCPCRLGPTAGFTSSKGLEILLQ